MRLKEKLVEDRVFLNYFRKDGRDSAINIAAARVLVGTYLTWKILSTNWANLSSWPNNYFEPYTFLVTETLLHNIQLVEMAAVFSLLIFILGYRLKITGLTSAVLVTYLSTLISVVPSTSATSSMFVASYIVVLYSLYPESDTLSLDSIRHATSGADLSPDRHGTKILKHSLVLIGLLYLFSGLSKIIYNPGLEWLTATNLGRRITFSHLIFGNSSYLEGFLLKGKFLMSVAAKSTVILEISLLLLTVAGMIVYPVIIALLLFHTSIYVVMGVNFLGMVILLLCFAAWDDLHEKLSPDREMEVIYQPGAHRQLGLLRLFSGLDHGNRLEFFTPDASDREEHPGEEITVISEDEAITGRQAYAELCSAFLLTRPAAFLLKNLKLPKPAQAEPESHSTHF